MLVSRVGGCPEFDQKRVLGWVVWRTQDLWRGNCWREKKKAFVEERSYRVEKSCEHGRENVTARNDAEVSRSQSELMYGFTRMMIFSIFMR